MTQIIETLSEISDRYDAVFCDLWGCVHNGMEAFDEAVAALRAFKAQGGTVLLLTNAPRPRGRSVGAGDDARRDARAALRARAQRATRAAHAHYWPELGRDAAL